MGPVDLLPFVPQLQGQETEEDDWHCYREVLPTFLLCLALLNKSHGGLEEIPSERRS